MGIGLTMLNPPVEDVPTKKEAHVEPAGPASAAAIGETAKISAEITFAAAGARTPPEPEVAASNAAIAMRMSMIARNVFQSN